MSPQFHVTYDPSFQTLKDISGKSKWRNKAGFVGQRETSEPRVKNPKGAPQPGDSRTNKRTTRSAPEGAETSKPARKRKRRESTSESEAGIPESQERKPATAKVGIEGSPTSGRGGDDANGQETDFRVQVTRSGRKTKPPQKLTDAVVAEIKHLTSGDMVGGIFCLQAMSPNDLHIHDDPLLAYKAVSDPDTLYYHQATKEPDWKEFKKGMTKEIDDQFANGNFTVVHRSEIPEGEVVLPAVWQMKRKRDARTGQIKKHKAKLNIDGLRMKQGVHYNKPYLPDASWNSVKMLLTLTAVHRWHNKQIDFVQAFAQAPVEKTLYMRILAGITIEVWITQGTMPSKYIATYSVRNQLAGSGTNVSRTNL